MFDLVNIIYSCVDMTTMLVGVSVFLIFGYIVSLRERSGIPPGPTFLPLLGNLLDMQGKYFGKRHKYFDDLMSKYGSVFRIYFGKQLTIILCDAESINEAFVKQKDIFTTRPSDKLWDIQQSSKTGIGLIWSNDQKWKSLRRMTLHTLRDLGVGKATLETRIKDETNNILDDFMQLDGKPIRVHEILMKATSNIISSVVFGARFDYDDVEFIRLLSFMTSAFDGEGPFTPINVIPQIRFLPVVSSKMQELIVGIHHIQDFITRKIMEHRDSLDKENPRDFIDICLLNSSNPISDDTLMKTILDLFLAGSDTTANTLDWAVLYMILNPHIQQKCHEEIDSVVDSNRMISWADKQNMPYVEATLLEVQRIANIAPITLPHTNTQDTFVKGYFIPEGSLVYGHLRACHLEETSWDQPLAFRPERFMGKVGNATKNVNFLPFSTGPRICPGEPLAKMELFLIFSNILKRFTLSQFGSDDLCTEGVFGVTMSTEPYYIQATCR